MSLETNVAKHYTRGDLAAAVLKALAGAGKNLDKLTLDDLAPLDEFHVRGRAATQELGANLGLAADMRVLDLGCGIGGPSRFFAATHGCTITGIDLTEEFCTVAAMLGARVGLGARVAYRQASALDLPFEDAAFDAAYTQHVAMNIADKARLYGEAFRVVKPGGTFGLYDVLQGPSGAVHFPVPWARTPETSFLVTPDELRALLEGAGFEVTGWRETTDLGRAWFAEMKRRLDEAGPPALGTHLLMGPDFPEMTRNMARNLTEDRVALIEAICRRP